jgi:hypothetical protein
MKLPLFLNTVPRGMRIAAFAVASCAICVGIIAGMLQGEIPAKIAFPSIGLFGGILAAIWLIGVGYVYADARRRGMPQVLWVFVVILIPNCLGFLLYFALRKPLLALCPSCGLGVAYGQPFCSWCGAALTAARQAGAPSQQDSSGLGPLSI